METVTLEADGLAATFAPGAGMVCCSLRHRGEELLGQRRGLEVYASAGKTMGIPLLHPWANRLGAWRFETAGRAVDLEGAPVSTDGSTGLPIHGLLPRPWQVQEREEARAVATLEHAAVPAFPFAHRVELAAEVAGGALRIATTIVAADAGVPVAFGFHPYLTLPGVARDDYEVSLPVRRRLVVDASQLPTGATEPAEPFAGRLGDRTFDDGYDRLDAAPFILAGGGRRVEVRFEGGYGVAQVFAPPGQDLICFEPMTAPADALRTGAFAVAEPGAPYRAAFSVTVLDAP